MFLAVPTAAAPIGVLANFEAARPIAILLSRTGRFDAPAGRPWPPSSAVRPELEPSGPAC